jgi:DNA sulfur modification protein DndD
MAATPDPRTLEPLRNRLDETNRQVDTARAALSLAEDLLQAANQGVAQAHTALDKALDAAHLADDGERLVTHVDRVTATLEQLRVAATDSNLHRICALAMEALDVLLRKDNLITGLVIDPETYTLTLSGMNGQAVETSDLSAGERQLLAVALLWGLARASGQPLPVVIDTPLGRLDGTHRHRLLERYFPEASHQVILLSTDTEIDEAGYAMLAPHVGRAYHLQFDPTTDTTTVAGGYFWRQP